MSGRRWLTTLIGLLAATGSNGVVISRKYLGSHYEELPPRQTFSKFTYSSSGNSSSGEWVRTQLSIRSVTPVRRVRRVRRDSLHRPDLSVSEISRPWPAARWPRLSRRIGPNWFSGPPTRRWPLLDGCLGQDHERTGRLGRAHRMRQRGRLSVRSMRIAAPGHRSGLRHRPGTRPKHRRSIRRRPENGPQ